MSASSKKKLRNAQEAEKMTEKQLQEQKEAKKLKTFTTVIVVVIALMVCFAVYTAVSRTITGSGILERNTVALTVGSHEVSNAELNYYFVDAVNNFYSSYGTYASMFGLNASAPLDEQVVDLETGETWADDFMSSAKANIQAVYALTDAAAEEGYTLSEDELANIEIEMSNISTYAVLYGYTDLEQYLKAMYGPGATEEGFRAYFEQTTLASSYQAHYAEHLTFEEADLRAAEAEKAAEYSMYSYNSYYLAVSRFLEGGAQGEDGVTTYSDEEKAAAEAEAEEIAKALTENTTIEELDAAIAALPVNAEVENAASTAYLDSTYANLNSTISDWIVDSARKEGDITYIPATTTSTDEAGTETTTVNGYYIVYFIGSNDNNYPLANVRHILVGFEGGTYDSNTGSTIYSDEEKAAAKAKAEELLAQWEAGEATEESFAELAKAESTDPGSRDNGGLYEDVYPGQMVTSFNDWCFEEGRKSGDTGIVETSYGYHIMFYSSDSETLYRDMLIENDLISNASNEWYNALVEAMVVTEVNTKYILTDLVLAN